jgi:hypothetical protein
MPFESNWDIQVVVEVACDFSFNPPGSIEQLD